MLGLVLEGCAHVAHPDRQRHGAAVLVAAEAFRLVETRPDGGDIVGVIAGEPAVLGLVGGAGLASQVATAHGQSTAASAALDHVLQHAGKDVSSALVDYLLGNHRLENFGVGVLRQGDSVLLFQIARADRRSWWIGDEQRLAVPTVDALDQVGLDLVAAISESGPAGGDFQRG